MHELLSTHPVEPPARRVSARRPWRWLLLVGLLIGSHSLLYYAATEEQRRVVLVVNGQEIPRRTLDVTLTTFRDQALSDLGTQVVIAQAAQRVGVAVDDEDLLDASPMDRELLLATLARRRTEALLRKLVLAAVKKAERAEVFRVFAGELTGYRLSYILLLESTDYAALDVDLRAGTSFDKIRTKYGKQNPPELTPDLLRPLRPEQLWELFGRRGSAIVTSLRPGRLSPPLQCGLGMVLVRLDAKENSSEQLDPAIDQVLFEAGKNRYLQELAEATAITSPLTWSATERKPANIYGDKMDGLAKPEPTSTVTPGHMPALRPPVIPASPTPMPGSSKTPISTAPPEPTLPIKIKTTAPEYIKGPLNAKIKTISFRLLADRWQGHAVLRLDTNNNHNADDQEPMLVRITADGWQPVEELPDSVNRFVMEKDLGYWVDQEAAHMEGPLWARKKVVDHPPNGILEPEEVTLKEFRASSKLFSGNLFELGAEIVRDNQGRLTEYEQTADFGRHGIERIDVERLEIYHETDANWEVRVEL